MNTVMNPAIYDFNRPVWSLAQAKAARCLDLKENAPYSRAICTALRHGWMQGVSATRFAPERAATRGMLVTVLWRMAGRPRAAGKQTFVDVNNAHYYDGPVAWAVNCGIAKGVDASHFAPDAKLSRQEAAVMLRRYCVWRGAVAAEEGKASFVDAENAAPYAKSSLAWAFSAGLLSGQKRPGGYALAPTVVLTRGQLAQAAVALDNFLARRAAA